jgi:MerR family transcriptional regulator, thiopeptide resistance regulator
MPKKPPDTVTLTAAECARRTGLTVRALRVYERGGLLKPSRSPKGWRLYGPKDLVRLNTVVALKGFGLSLAQIRKAFGASPPALAQVLDLQVGTWAARKMAAERAIALIQAAIAKLRTRADLSIDELCDLMRSTEVNSMQSIVRELINEHITPEQEREWLTYWAQRQQKEVVDGQGEITTFRAIAEEFLALMRLGAAPDSAAVQEVAERSHRAWLDSNLRQRQLEQLAWNPEVTRAWFALGGKLLARSAAQESTEEAARLEKFMNDARRAMRSSQLLMPIVAEAQRLRELGTRPEDPDARRLAKQYAQLCKVERMGDPALHARWIAEFGHNLESRPAWDYLARLSAR